MYFMLGNFFYFLKIVLFFIINYYVIISFHIEKHPGEDIDTIILLAN